MTEPTGSAWPPPRPDTLVSGTTPQGPRLPGVVQAAVVVTYVCAAVVAGMTVLMLLSAAFVGAFILEYFEPADRAEIVGAVVGGSFVLVVACAVAAWLAWQTSRRKVWARLGLALCSAFALAASVVALTPYTLVVLPGSAAVLVLLFLPRANAWFRATRPSAG